MRFLYDPSAPGRVIFPNVFWSSPNHKILITFDDSPHPESTQFVLDELDKYEIKSVFFCVGDAVTRYDNELKQIKDRGHLIGNHAFSHEKLIFRKNSFIEEELSQTNKVINSITGKTPNFFRPPYGRLSPRIIKLTEKQKMKTMMWSLLTHDYKNDLKIVKFALDKYLKSNSIIVFHDRPQNKNILNDSIKYLIEKVNEYGFQIGDPHECLK